MPGNQRRKTRIEMLLGTAGMLVGALALGAVAFFAGTSAWRMYERMRLATNEMETARSQMAVLQEQDNKTKAAFETLSTPEGVEAAVRERYGVARPGEGVIQIIEQDVGASDGNENGGNIFVRMFNAIWPW